MDTSSDSDAPSPRKAKHDPYEDDDDDYHRESKRDVKHNKEKVEEKKVTLADLGRLQLTRAQLAKECAKPWFEEYVKGV